MPTKKKGTTKRKSSKSNTSDSIMFAFLATFFTIIGFIIAIISKRDDKYVMFYAKQGLVVFIGYLIVMAIGMIPLIGWLAWVLLTVIWVISWINALSGEKRNTFIVGDIANKIKL